MIGKGYFSDAHINLQNREIVLPNTEKVDVNIEAQSIRKESQETKVITCKRCRANNTIIVASITECEYCKSSLA